jgi:hypothetical protein
MRCRFFRVILVLCATFTPLACFAPFPVEETSGFGRLRVRILRSPRVPSLILMAFACELDINSSADFELELIWQMFISRMTQYIITIHCLKTYFSLKAEHVLQVFSAVRAINGWAYLHYSIQISELIPARLQVLEVPSLLSSLQVFLVGEMLPRLEGCLCISSLSRFCPL